MLSKDEILQTIHMIDQQHLDIRTITTVSYTHLDVYKRQIFGHNFSPFRWTDRGGSAMIAKHRPQDMVSFFYDNTFS